MFFLSLKLLHLLLFVYWLGADLGVVYASRFVADRSLPPASRGTAAKIMLGVDIAPRLCMPLVLGSGVHLAALVGALPIGGRAVVLAWAVSLAWLAMVMLIHHRGPSGAAALVRVDFVFRVVIIAALLAMAFLRGPLATWTMVKLLGFAGTIACGLMIRVHLKPFGAAFAQMLAGRGDERSDALIASSIARCRPYVVAIWLILVTCAAAGLHLIG